MNPRQAAFSLLRRAALQGFRRPGPISRFQPILRNYRATPSFRESSSAQLSSNSFKVPKPKTEPAQEKPAYDLTFTCKPCSTRSTHRVSKQGYHNGSVLITCPECKNRHVISDHLKIFGDTSMTIEDLMREKGQLVKKGTLSEDGDLEFWEDGTVSDRGKNGSE